MRALILWANDISPNLGVRALAEGTAQLVRSVDPSAEIHFHHHGTTSAPIKANSRRALLRELTPANHGLVKWLSGFDVVIDTRSGDSFSDIYGLGRQMVMTGIAELCGRAGVPVVLGPQTIGPFESRRGRLLARRTLRSAACVMARDPESARQADRLGAPVDVLTTDVVFALGVPEPDEERDVVLNVSGLLSRPSPHVDADAYRAMVRSLLVGLRERGRRVSLLAHVLDSGDPDNDVPAIVELAGEPDVDVEVIVPESLDEVRRVVRGAGLVLGSRMHACLNALSVGTPAIALAYSRKFDPLLADLGWEHCVDLRSEEAPAAAALALVDREPELTQQVVRVREAADERLSPALDALACVMHVGHG